MSDHDGLEGIAIIGMAGRFPGAPDVDTLWSNLCAGVESVRPSSDEELLAAGAHTKDPGFVNASAAMDGIEEFDASFFGMSRREAELTDPQHRILLEAAWGALEHAGHDPSSGAERIGIFGGVAENLYFRRNLLAHPDLLAKVGYYPLLLATAREYAITRTAYKLGLTGPAVAIITACSTSAVATHLAVQSLLAGDCDIALAGGAHLNLPARAGYVYQEDGILSPDGHVRAFDAAARGTIMASGVAFIALKRLADAHADADTIYAVVRGSAVNNDGATKVGFTAPSLDGQRAVVEDALAVADVDASTIGMVEAHGTGTSLGDPIEFAAITEAFRRHTDRRQYCAIGTLKSNIGHLDAAAGTAGIIKATLALHHEKIPPSINFGSPNPQIDLESSPFFVNTELLPWQRTTEPRRAGISSFGFGGTNAHVVLEEGPAPIVLPDPPTTPLILTLSAKTADALGRLGEQLAERLIADPAIDLADAAHTLAVGRSRMPHRSAVIASDSKSAVSLLRQADPYATAERSSAVNGAEVAFLFTGQGAQYAGAGLGLYHTEPVFAQAIRECAGIVGPLDGHDLVELLFGEDVDPAVARERILHTAVGQPGIFTLQYALARLWENWGVRPAALVGHSIGELAAACLGGVFSLEDALDIAMVRGRLMEDLPRGAMTAVLADEAAVLPLLEDSTSLAAVNAPEQCVVSGPPASIETLEARLTANDIPFRRLPTDRAFHSSMMEPMVDALSGRVARTTPGELRIPMVSTKTGAWATAHELGDPVYWGQHARQTVRFMDAVGVLLKERPDLVLLEIGPGETLTSLVLQHGAVSAETVAISTLPPRGADVGDSIHARRALAEAWAAGVDVDLVAANGGRRRRIALPTYPFARERHWIEGRATFAPTISDAMDAPPVDGAPVAEAGQTPAVQVGSPQAGDRRSRIAGQITAILADLSGLDATELDASATFSDLGFDSLFLTQANAQIRRRFGVRVTIRQLLGETPTIAMLAERIDAELAPDALVAPEAAVPEAGPPPGPLPGISLEQTPAASPSTSEGNGAEADPVRWLLNEQMRLMEKQIEVMRAYIGANHGTTGMTTVPASVPGAVSNGPTRLTPVPILPNVVRYMSERETPNPEQWNLGVMLTPTRHLDPAITRRVMGALMERHDALRLRFVPQGDSWTAALASASGPVPFDSSDLSGVASADQAAAIESRAGEVQKSLDLEHGPMIRMELFDLGDAQRLLVVAHHFVMDQLSWPPFWADFETLYDGFARGVAVSLPSPVTTFEGWARALQRHADSDLLRAEAEAWRELPWERIRPIPLDHPGGANTNRSAEELQLVLATEETDAWLRQTTGVVRKADLIVTALASTMAKWTGSDTVLIDMMGHGRDDGILDGVDPMETVGFFISYTPLVLRLPDATSPVPPLTEQIEPIIRRGLSFDLLRYMTSDDSVRAMFRALPRAEVLFNHHGQRDEPDEAPRSPWFTTAAESIGETHSPGGIRYYPLAISSEIHYGRLRLNFVYSSQLHARATIEALSAAFYDELRAIIGRAVG